jgi:plasmid stabilization system protein ParE
VTPLVWTEPAIADLAAIQGYIGRDSEVYASAVVQQIIATVERLAEYPRLGRAGPEVRRAESCEVLVRSYRVIYRARPGRVEVLAIVHGARDLRRLKPRPWRRRPN